MTKNKTPEILLVGLPNSGKSTLINKLLGTADISTAGY